MDCIPPHHHGRPCVQRSCRATILSQRFLCLFCTTHGVSRTGLVVSKGIRRGCNTTCNFHPYVPKSATQPGPKTLGFNKPTHQSTKALSRARDFAPGQAAGAPPGVRRTLPPPPPQAAALFSSGSFENLRAAPGSFGKPLEAPLEVRSVAPLARLSLPPRPERTVTGPMGVP